MKRCLLDHGGEENLVGWYYDYLTHRDLKFELHGEEMIKSTSIGFPQGGVCSAKFWLIAFDMASKIINTLSIEGNGYADDCSAVFGGPRVDHLVIRMQKMLDSLIPWGKKCGLRFNPSKTVAILFTRKRKTHTHFLKIEGEKIEYSNNVRYLGVELDKKLHWKIHVSNKITRAKKYLTNLVSIAGNTWGPSPKVIRWIYTGIIRPCLLYTSPSPRD